MAEFLSMGGYAEYVWSAYGVTITIMMVMTLLALLKSRRTLHKLKFEHGLKAKRQVKP
jgi:heme exporter protein D